MNESIVCCCCNSNLEEVGNKNNYHIWLCPNCDFMTTYPLPSLQELKAIYKKEYFIKQENKGIKNRFGYNNFLSKGAIKGSENISIIRLKIIGNLVGQKESILDVGCAAGTFLDVASKQGWFTAGVELNPQMRNIASKYCTENKVESSLGEVNGKYSVITMWEYLEHVLDPVAEIKKIQTLLKPGGLICLSFPNMECKKDIEVKLAWEQIKPPEHLHYWKASNIKLFLEKYGFFVVGFRYHGNKFQLEGVRKLGSRKNPKTILWPLRSLSSRLMKHLYYTGFRKKFPIYVRKMYEGIEVYAKIKK